MVAAMRKYFRNLPLIRKFFSILLAAVIPVTLVSFWGSSWIAGAYSELLYENIAAQLSYSAQEISNHFRDVESLSYMVFSYDKIQSGLRTIRFSSNDIARADATASMRSLLGSFGQNYRSSYVSYINVFADQFSVSSNSYAASETPESVFQEIRTTARETDGSVIWYSTPLCPDKIFLGREIREISELSLKPLGEEVICVNIGAVAEAATLFNNQYEQAEYLILRDGDVLYSTQDLAQEDALKIREDLTGKYQVVKLGGRNYFAVSGKLPYYDWDYLCLVPFDNVMVALNGAKGLSTGLLILCSVGVLAFAYALIASLNRHFSVLITKMKVMGEDASYSPQTETYNYNDRTDEIGVLHQQFDLMAAKIQNLIRINYVNELLKKEARLKALENQINPHFLYNTLESVNWRAKACGAEDISIMVQSLAALLRVTLGQSNASFTLKQELELVQSYMAIQEYRFEDRLEFHVSVPPELYPVHIVKLTIQPLVENAIHYGLEENTETCEITISARQMDGHRLQIIVTNTGSVFEDDLLEKLRTSQIIPHGHGIGLLNIDKRLKLTYGEEYGLELHNEEDRAVAVVTIPMERGEELC